MGENARSVITLLAGKREVHVARLRHDVMSDSRAALPNISDRKGEQIGLPQQCPFSLT